MLRRGLIVGGGIGGLTAALALQRADLETIVLERASELREPGVGIALWPNAVRALRALGVGEAVEAAATVQAEIGLRNWRGDRILDLRLEGAPLLVLHSASLRAALAQALGAGVLRLGSECSSVDQDTTRATVRLTDGRPERGDFVIGADGLHSRVRAVVFGEEAPRYSGYTAWRGVVPLDDTLASRVQATESWGRGALFGITRLGGSQAFWYASARAPEHAGRSAGDKAELLRRFGGWHDPIPELVDATAAEAISRTALYDRPPLACWSAGRIALLGDAAHPMLPHLGQGACQAIEDAAALADAMATSSAVEHALAEYGRLRTRHAARVARRSRQAACVAHVRNPLAVGLRNLIVRATPPRAVARTLTP